MMQTANQHPASEQIRAYGEGRLAPEAAARIEQHLGECDSCCRLLEEAPPDSFLDRLRDAGQNAAGTTADQASGTLADAPAVPPELAGHPRYRVLGLLGQGGMGAVYRAEHLRMERPVALKVINPGLMRNPTTVQRFQQEVKAAAKLHHANIVTAHDADQAGELHFLVMEHVEGQSLAQRVGERGPLPVAEACEWIRQAALGLQHAHERGMVHRDIKPHNLMLTADGTVKILDFGLARLAHPVAADAASSTAVSAPGLTAAGAVMGTADYIAPEQAADPRTADIRADVYSLGCTLFHLLTGQPPFPDGSVQEKIAKHTTAPLPPLTNLPPGLAAVLANMTAKEPAKRYATPVEVAAALAPFCRAPAPRWARSRLRRWLAVAAVLLAVGFAAGVVVRVTNDRGDVTTVQSDDKSFELTVTKGRIVSIRDLKTASTWNVDTENLRIADASRPEGLTIELPRKGKMTLRSRDGRIVTVSTEPNEVAEPSKPVRVVDPVELAKHSNAADGLKQSDIPKDALVYLDGGDPASVPPELVAVLGDMRFRCSERPGPMAFSPDGKQLAVSNGSNEIRFFDAKTGRLLRQLTSSYAPKDRMAFSPDGRFLMGTNVRGEFNVFDAETGRLRWKLTETRVPSVDRLAFLSDGKPIVALSCKLSKAPPLVEVRDAATGFGMYFLDTGPDGATDFAFSPDLVTFVSVGRDKGVVTYLNRKTSIARQLPGQGERVVFSPDGKHFAVLWKGDEPDDGKVTVHDAAGKVLHDLRVPADNNATPEDKLLAFTPDGQTLIAVSSGGVTHCTRWDVAQGKKLGSWTFLNVRSRSAFDVLSADGRMLARRCYGSCRVELYDTETGKPLSSRIGHERSISALAFSPDGKLLASTDRYATRLWDLATNREVATRFEHAVHHLTFSPDGNLLVGANGSRIAVYTVRDGTIRHWLDARTVQIDSIAFHPDGSLIAAASGDDVRVWRVTDGKEVRILGNQSHVFSVSFSPDGSRILAAGDGIRIWETHTGLEIKHVKGNRDYLLEWFPDGKTFAVTHTEGYDQRGYVLQVDPESGEILKRQSAPIPYPMEGPRMFPHAISPGARFLCLCQDRGFLLLQAFSDPARRRMFRLAPSEYPRSSQRTAAFSPDGRYLACGNAEGIISLLRLSEEGKLPVLQVLAPTARELADRPNAADALKHEDVPEAARAYIGGGDPNKVPPELVAVLGESRFRLPGATSGLAYSPNGELLAVASTEKVLWIFDLPTRRLLRGFPNPFTPYWRLAFTPDGKSLVGLLPQGKLGLIDPVTGQLLWKLEDTELRYVRDFAFSTDGKRIGVVSGTSSVVEEHDAVTGKKLRTWKTNGNSAWIGLVFSPDQSMFVTLADTFSGDRPAVLWDSSDRLLGSLGSRAVGAVFSPDGKVLVVARRADPGTVSAVTLYDRLSDPRERHHLWAGENEWPIAAFMPDGKVLLTVGSNDRATLLTRRDVTTGRKLGMQTIPKQPGTVILYALSPDGKEVALAEKGGPQVRLFDTETGEPRVPESGHRAALTALAWSPDGKQVASSDGATVKLWDLATTRTTRTWEMPGVSLLAFSPDSQGLAAVGERIRVYRVTDGELLYESQRYGQAVLAIAFSPDGKLLASGGEERLVRIHDLPGLVEQRVLDQQQQIRALRFSLDGRHLFSAGVDGIIPKVRVWEMASGLEKHGWKLANIPRQIEPMPDGRTLAILIQERPGEVWFLDWTTGDVTQKRPGLPAEAAAWPSFPALGPGGRLAAFSSSRAGALVVAEPQTDRARQHTFQLSPASVSSVAFSPDGRYLAVGDRAGLVSILRLAERGQVPELPVREP
jgi:WD40 repeat protein